MQFEVGRKLTVPVGFAWIIQFHEINTPPTMRRSQDRLGIYPELISNPIKHSVRMHGIDYKLDWIYRTYASV